MPIQCIGRPQSCQILCNILRGGRQERHRGQFQSPGQFPEPKARHATIEVLERVDRQEPSLGERQVLGQKIRKAGCPHVRKARLQVGTVRDHEFGDPERGRRGVISHFYIATSPPARPVGDEVPAQLPVEGADEPRRNRLPRKLAGRDRALHHQRTLRQQRSQLAIAQDSTRGFDETGGPMRRCSSSSHAKSTGSPSNAMESATLRGMLCQRRRKRSSSGKARHRSRHSATVMAAI